MRNVFLLVISLVCFACNNDSMLLTHANEISLNISKQMAPDGREAIYKPVFSVNDSKSIVVSGETSLPEAKLALFLALEELSIHLIDSLILLPEKELGDLNWGLVNLSVVNLRSRPRHSAELVSQAIMGTPVKVLKKKGSWCLIQTPDKYIAWVDEAALSLKTKDEMKLWQSSERVVFLPSFEIAKDDEQKKIVTDLVAGSILELDQSGSSFFRLLLPDGRKIKVKKSCCELFSDWCDKGLNNTSVLTKTAKEFTGRPYLWGGTSSKGVDCSGFVKSVYFMNGVILARDASQQFLYGDTIMPEQGFEKLREGDLVFFGKKETQDNPIKVTHVGMYINNSEYIHASGRVKINSFDVNAENYNEYRSISWLGARNIVNRIGEPGLLKVSDHPWYLD